MKPETTPKNPKDFNADKFWRHYVATDATDADMLEDEKKTGNASRIFIFLLLLHAFFIGAVVLYNLVAERPKPAFVDATGPVQNSGDGGKFTPAPIVQGKTKEYVVASGDSIKTIADKTGATQEEIIRLNGLDRGQSIAAGKKLVVPDNAPPKAAAVAVAVPPQVPLPGAAPQEVVVAVQHTTRPGVMETFRAVEPRNSEASTAKAVIQDSPPEKVEAVAQTRPMKVEDKLPEDPKPVKKNVEDSPPAAKPAEAKPAPARPADPKPEAKVAATKKTQTPAPAAAAAKPAEAKPNVAKPAEAKPAAAKPAASKPASEVTHTVKSGETPYAIARKYGITPDQLMRHNSIKDPSKLKIGAVLKVPAKQ